MSHRDAAYKAWQTIWRRAPARKAARTAKWARTMTKWVVTHSHRGGARWKIVDFGGSKGAESRGIVDLMAVRKDHRPTDARFKPGDLFEIILVQVKGGGAAHPTADDRLRLRAVAKRYRARVVLSSWERQGAPEIYLLRDDRWVEKSPVDIFG